MSLLHTFEHHSAGYCSHKNERGKYLMQLHTLRILLRVVRDPRCRFPNCDVSIISQHGDNRPSSGRYRPPDILPICTSMIQGTSPDSPAGAPPDRDERALPSRSAPAHRSGPSRSRGQRPSARSGDGASGGEPPAGRDGDPLDRAKARPPAGCRIPGPVSVRWLSARGSPFCFRRATACFASSARCRGAIRVTSPESMIAVSWTRS